MTETANEPPPPERQEPSTTAGPVPQQSRQENLTPPNLAALMQVLGQPGGLPYGPQALGGPFAIAPSLSQQSLQMWQGPYVPPDAAEHYEALVPGSFNRMLAMNESRQAAQIADSRRAMDYLRADNRRGHWLGFASTIAAMIGALVCVALNEPWMAATFFKRPGHGSWKSADRQLESFD